MADDNVLSAIGGFAEGVQSVLVPYLVNKANRDQEYQNQVRLLQTKNKLESIPAGRIDQLSGIKTGLSPTDSVSPHELPVIEKRIGEQSAYQKLLAEQQFKQQEHKNAILSVEDSIKLGVPYGTTSQNAYGKTPTQKPGQDFKSANEMRKEFIDRPEVKEFMTTNTSVNSMDSLLKNARNGNIQNKVALDQALITLYNKMTDANSTVRESEYARTPENLSTVNRITGAIEKLKQGGAGLTDEDRDALVLGAKIITNERGASFSRAHASYSKLAQQYQIDPSLVTGTLPKFKPFEIGTPVVTPPPGSEAKKNKTIDEIYTEVGLSRK